MRPVSHQVLLATTRRLSRINSTISAMMSTETLRKTKNTISVMLRMVSSLETSSNIANTLVKLHRYDEARTEITRAIECKQPFGHVALPWTSWGILHNIEVAVGNTGAAQAAWQQARSAYLAYRRDGGYAQAGGGQLCGQILPALQAGQMDEVSRLMSQLQQHPEASSSLRLLIDKLQAIVAGSRDGTLADDIALNFDDASEILLLLERLVEM